MFNKLYVQTQVATVIDYYKRWMEAFPTIYDLASADIEVGIFEHWEGKSVLT